MTTIKEIAEKGKLLEAGFPFLFCKIKLFI